MNTTDGKALAATIEANKRHLEWFFEGAEAPVDYLARRVNAGETFDLRALTSASSRRAPARWRCRPAVG